MHEILALINVILEIIKQLMGVIAQLLVNPILAIVGGVILAFLPRYIFWAIGLALIVYGVVMLVTDLLGVKLTWGL